MKRFHLAALSVLLFLSAFTSFLVARPGIANAGTTKVAYERWLDARTLDLYVQSPSTDSWVKEVRLILPDGWTRDTSKKWPALWLMHGGKDDYSSWTKGTDIEALSAKHDMMVVIPNTSWCSSYTDWWNYGKYGSPAWETYITSDLRNLLQDNYHADGNDAAIAGVSMGGLGALKLAMNHPDMFKGVASFSGNADPLHAYNSTTDSPDPPTIGCLAVPDWKKVWGDYHIAEQRAIWERNDPYVQVAKFAKMKYLFVSSGDGLSNPMGGQGSMPNFLEQQVNVESRAFASHLQDAGVPADTDFYAGIHDWPYWQNELHAAFPGLLKAIDVQ